ncbi:Short-chain dehydrogenase/reductase SDR [Macrophomina phaseolina MS6]|uniref:Short-chain dehydrogenase/reductase SDR n=1 Tax=Macrophomina phaseolina (strain MS6) TaxID=1126212 RepID=K2RY61_MACPH|nr:Short-chain dehydrogenase/reductase SDR [Macrophomina phaseolina MS6]
MSLSGQTVLITGASKGIGAAIARRLATTGATLILLSTPASLPQLTQLTYDLRSLPGSTGAIHHASCDVRSASALSSTITSILQDQLPNNTGIDILINNAGLALGAPALFPHQSIADITTMTDTNINGYMHTAHATLNAGHMLARARGTILNVTSTTGLEVPPFPGEAVYHACKAAQEAFTNVLRTELRDTSIRVVAVRPGVVATHFHEQRVGYDRGLYDEFMDGFEPLVAEDVAECVAWVLERPQRVAEKALDVVPTAQRSLQVFDRRWNERNGA